MFSNELEIIEYFESYIKVGQENNTLYKQNNIFYIKQENQIKTNDILKIPA